MSRTISIDGTSRAALTRLDSWVFSECANRGQVGLGTMVLDDQSSINVPAMKTLTVDESAASVVRMFTGYTGQRQYQRGPLRAGTDRQQSVEILDFNTFLDDKIITGTMQALGSGTTASRPQESDYQRASWLLATTAMTSVDHGNIAAGYVPNSNTVTMDAVDYRGQNPRQVLDDCAQKSGKNYFLYMTVSGSPLLFYDLDTQTGYTSSMQISDDPADIDNSTVFGPDFGRSTIYTKDPLNIYSTVRLRYKRGVATVTDATTLATFRQREKSITHMKTKTAARATEQAQKWLDQADAESETLGPLTIHVPAANVNDIRAGQRMQVKIRSAGITSFTYYRCIQRDIRPHAGDSGVSDVEYSLTLTFVLHVKPTHFSAGTYVDEEQSNATDDNATVIIDSGGITVTNGAITVTNGAGTVIIDGTSDIFKINVTGTLTIPKNTVKGYTKASVWINTALLVNPLTVWGHKVTDSSGDIYYQQLPDIFCNNAGQVLVLTGGRARYEVKNGNDGTRVQGFKFTSNATNPAEVVRYYLLVEQAF